MTLSIVSKAFTGGSGRKPPKRKKPLYEKRGQTHSREQVDGNEQMMRIRSEYEIELQDTVPFEKGLATVRFRYSIQQDDKVGPDCCELVIDAPDGFVAQETKTREADLVGTDGLTKVVKMPRWYEYRGPIAKGEAPAVFKILTKPFLADWILKPELQYTVVPEAGEDLVADETDG